MLAAMTNTEVLLESVVMMGVVTRVVWSLLGTGVLTNEAVGLVILTAIGLGLELVCGRSPLIRRLNARSSLSTGILLGSVTLPLVLSCRLVQLLRCVSSSEVSPVAVENLRYEFWLAVACSMSMLVLVMSLLWRHRVGSWIFLTFVEYSSVAVLVLMTPKQGLSLNWAGLWGLVYILGGKLLFSYVLWEFPFCGTIGEVILVVEGIVLYGANAAAHSLARVLSVSLGDSVVPNTEQQVARALSQGIILGVLLLPLVYNILCTCLSFVFKGSQIAHDVEASGKEHMPRIYRAGLFYVVLFLVIFAAVPQWLGTIVGLQLNPVLWAIQFVLHQPVKRLLLGTYWVVIVCLPLPHLYRISTSGQVPNILLRKYYHVMVVVLFLPALLIDSTFLQLAFGVALTGFLVLEMIRVWKIPPFGHIIDEFMTAFTDHRDSGVLIISHFSLLLGCALPVWLDSGAGDRPLASFAGILSLGIGDTMASVIGYNFGSIRVSSKSKKTLEGTLSCIGSVLVCCLLLLPMFSPATRPAGIVEYMSLVYSTIASGALEAYTLQLDNAFLPLIFYSLLCL